MKKIIAIILSISFVCCLYGCGKGAENDKPVQNDVSTQNPTDNSKENTENPSVTIPSSEKGEYTIYGRSEQHILIHKDTDFGSYGKPHKIGDTVRLRHSNIITAGNSNPKKSDIYDYNLAFEQVLTGKKAEQKLKELCSNFDEEKYLFENNDVYLIKANVKYNPESKINDRLPGDIYVAAINSQGKYVNVEHRFDISEYHNETKNGEVSNWYPIFVPKGENVKPAFVIGSPMEYPGPVAAVYYDK